MEKPQQGGAEYAQDGSVDLRGNPVLRSKRGGWTACSFIVGTCFLVPAAVRCLASSFIVGTDRE